MTAARSSKPARAFSDDAFYGVIGGGKLHLDDKPGFDAFLTARFADGEEVEVIVQRVQTRQGNPAMRYYRGPVLTTIWREQGYTDPADKERIHQGLKEKFLQADERKRLTTAKCAMSRQRFAEYLDAVVKYAECDLSIRIPRPSRAVRDWHQGR